MRNYNAVCTAAVAGTAAGRMILTKVPAEKHASAFLGLGIVGNQSEMRISDQCRRIGPGRAYTDGFDSTNANHAEGHRVEPAGIEPKSRRKPPLAGVT